MTESEAKKMVKRKHDAPNKKQSLDGWIYQPVKRAAVQGGWAVERRRKDGMGFSLYRSAAN